MEDLPGCRVLQRDEDGCTRPFLVWDLREPWRVVSSAAVGGGIGDRRWIMNAQVAPDYDRTDLTEHVAALADLADLVGVADRDGVGLLTAADVTHGDDVHDDGVVVRASVGIRLPVLAGTAPREPLPTGAVPGTINV